MQIISQDQLLPGDVFIMGMQGDMRIGKVIHRTKSGSVKYSHGNLSTKEIEIDGVHYHTLAHMAPPEKHNSFKYLPKPWTPNNSTGRQYSHAKTLVLLERDGRKVQTRDLVEIG